MLQSKVIGWLIGLRKHDPSIFCLQETYFRSKDTHRVKVRGWKDILQADGNQKKAGVAILISDYLEFKTKSIKTKSRERHYIMIKGSIQKRI